MAQQPQQKPQAPAKPLSAKASDPVAMGWMQGSPPTADKTIRFSDTDFFAFPKLRWTVCHFRDLMPTAGVGNGAGAARPLPTAMDASLDAVRFTPLGTNQKMTWAEAFDANYTDGIVVLHRGRIVYERYFGVLKDDGQHAAMSVTKSVIGTLGAALVAWLGRAWPERQEALIGLLYVGAASLAVLLVSADPHGAQTLHGLLSGDVLWASWPRLLPLALATAVFLLALAWRPAPVSSP